MSEKEIVTSLTEAVSVLPERQQEYILGYAEGMRAAMESMCRNDQSAVDHPSA